MAARAPASPKKDAPTKRDVEKQSLPLQEQIRRRAHEIYVQRGGQDGSELDDWLKAEGELRQADDEESVARAEGEGLTRK
jgi:chromosome condensin MukBEF ATPase and DNA-binding subunit MukB